MNSITEINQPVNHHVASTRQLYAAVLAAFMAGVIITSVMAVHLGGGGATLSSIDEDQILQEVLRENPVREQGLRPDWAPSHNTWRPSKVWLMKQSINHLRMLMKQEGLRCSRCIEKVQLVDAIITGRARKTRAWATQQWAAQQRDKIPTSDVSSNGVTSGGGFDSEAHAGGYATTMVFAASCWYRACSYLMMLFAIFTCFLGVYFFNNGAMSGNVGVVADSTMTPSRVQPLQVPSCTPSSAPPLQLPSGKGQRSVAPLYEDHLNQTRVRGKGLTSELATCWQQEVRCAGSVLPACDEAAVNKLSPSCTMDELLTMGFTDEARNCAVLEQTGGDLTQTIRILVNNERAVIGDWELN